MEVYDELEKALKEIERLKERIDKAIEYIKKEFGYDDGTLSCGDKELVEILKGSDKE